MFTGKLTRAKISLQTFAFRASYQYISNAIEADLADPMHNRKLPEVVNFSISLSLNVTDHFWNRLRKQLKRVKTALLTGM